LKKLLLILLFLVAHLTTHSSEQWLLSTALVLLTEQMSIHNTNSLEFMLTNEDGAMEIEFSKDDAPSSDNERDTQLALNISDFEEEL